MTWLQTMAIGLLTATAEDSIESNREAHTERLKITILQMSASGSYYRAETMFWVTQPQECWMLHQPLCPGSGSRAAPGGRYRNLFIVQRVQAAPPSSLLAFVQKCLCHICHPLQQQARALNHSVDSIKK